MQRHKMDVYREASSDSKQFRILCQQEVGIVADERSELAARKARLDSYEAGQTIQRGADIQAVAETIGRHLRIQFEHYLPYAQSEARNYNHACNDIKAQLKDALEKLKITDDELKAVKVEFQEFRDDAQLGVEELIARYADREKEMYRRFAWQQRELFFITTNASIREHR